MKILDQPYKFYLSNLLEMDWFLNCQLQIFNASDHSQTVLTENMVLVTNMGFEMGWFVPNLIEGLVNQVVREFNLNPQHLIWIEHYPVGGLTYYQDVNSTGFRMINFNWQGGKATQPQWVPITVQGFQNLIGADLKQVLEGYSGRA